MDASELDQIGHLAEQVATHRARCRAADNELLIARDRLREAEDGVTAAQRALRVAQHNLLMFAEANAR